MLVAAVGAALLAFRVAIMGGDQPHFNPLEIPAAFSESLLTRTLTWNYLSVFNAGLLVAPVTLSMDWSHGSIPLVTSVGDPRVAVTFAFYVLVACLATFMAGPLLRRWGAVLSATQAQRAAVQKKVPIQMPEGK